MSKGIFESTIQTETNFVTVLIFHHNFSTMLNIIDLITKFPNSILV